VLHWLFSGHKQGAREKKICPGNSPGTEKKEKKKKETKENPPDNGTSAIFT